MGKKSKVTKISEDKNMEIEHASKRRMLKDKDEANEGNDELIKNKKSKLIKPETGTESFGNEDRNEVVNKSSKSLKIKNIKKDKDKKKRSEGEVVIQDLGNASQHSEIGDLSLDGTAQKTENYQASVPTKVKHSKKGTVTKNRSEEEDAPNDVINKTENKDKQESVRNKYKENKFVNDGSTEIQKNTNKTKKKTFLNEDEAQVMDEDIDRFCDELNEEDNEQFEDWVKLIEASFTAKKKKT